MSEWTSDFSKQRREIHLLEHQLKVSAQSGCSGYVFVKEINLSPSWLEKNWVFGGGFPLNDLLMLLQYHLLPTNPFSCYIILLQGQFYIKTAARVFRMSQLCNVCKFCIFYCFHVPWATRKEIFIFFSGPSWTSSPPVLVVWFAE